MKKKESFVTQELDSIHAQLFPNLSSPIGLTRTPRMVPIRFAPISKTNELGLFIQALSVSVIAILSAELLGELFTPCILGSLSV